MRLRVPLIELLKSRYPQRTEQDLRAQILRGKVLVDGRTELKPGVPVAPEARLQVPPVSAFVSRGGEKLAAALEEWGIPCEGSPWIDAGCSTGGFTDCLLQRGAPLVYAVDVGRGQLAWSLRTDARVRNLEGTNIMEVRRADLDPPPGRAVADLSFRSLEGAARHILQLTLEAWGIFLVKPQFEIRSPAEDFHGVLKDLGTVRRVVQELLHRLRSEGVYASRLMPSPVSGRKGNREYLVLLRMGTEDADVELVVE